MNGMDRCSARTWCCWRAVASSRVTSPSTSSMLWMARRGGGALGSGGVALAARWSRMSCTSSWPSSRRVRLSTGCSTRTASTTGASRKREASSALAYRRWMESWLAVSPALSVSGVWPEPLALAMRRPRTSSSSVHGVKAMPSTVTWRPSALLACCSTWGLSTSGRPCQASRTSRPRPAAVLAKVGASRWPQAGSVGEVMRSNRQNPRGGRLYAQKGECRWAGGGFPCPQHAVGQMPDQGRNCAPDCCDGATALQWLCYTATHVSAPHHHHRLQRPGSLALALLDCADLTAALRPGSATFRWRTPSPSGGHTHLPPLFSLPRTPAIVPQAHRPDAPTGRASGLMAAPSDLMKRS